MGNIGKNPHRPEGKQDADAWHEAKPWGEGIEPGARQRRNLARLHGRDAEPVDKPLPGERPGVPSRVRGALDAQEEREDRAED